jgi:HSP20 family protein
MSLIKYNPSWDPFREMDDMMQRMPMMRGGALTPSNFGGSFLPAVDVYETKESVVVEASLPGIDPVNVEVSIDNNIVSIKGEHKKEREVEEKNYYQKEVRSGSFYRTVPLPTVVKEDQISAEFEDGVLKIMCPKESPGESKKVSVKVVKKKS